MVDTSPETWRWIWLVAALFFLGGEMVVPGTFFLLPFGISAGVAVVLAFIGVAVWVQFVVWLVLGTAMFAWFFRWSKRYAGENETPIGVGADRLLGEVGPVVATIPAGPTQSGQVRLGAEMWNAESDQEQEIPDGAVVRVVEVRGTRVIVTPMPGHEGGGAAASEESD